MANTIDPPLARQRFEDGNGLAYAVEPIIDFSEAIALAEHSHPNHGPILGGQPFETCQVDSCVKWREVDRRWRRFMAGILP